jgi:hypothetical protein
VCKLSGPTRTLETPSAKAINIITYWKIGCESVRHPTKTRN